MYRQRQISSYGARRTILRKKQRDARKSKTSSYRRAYDYAYRLSRVPVSSNGVMTIYVKDEPTNSVVTSTAAADGLYSWSFKLADLVDTASYAAIYDQYKINWIKAMITPVVQNSTPGTTYNWAPLVCAIDYDDANTPTSYYQVLQYGNSMIITTNPTQGTVVRQFIPCVAGGVYDSTAGALRQSSVQAGQWIDIGNTNVDHYGFKVAVKQSTTTNVSQYYIVFQYCISFNNTR